MEYWKLQLVLVLQLQTLFVSEHHKGICFCRGISDRYRVPTIQFGSRKIQPNDGLILSIWFDKIPDKTIEWHAQGVNTITGLVPDGSNVTFTADRGLALTDPRGQHLWSSSFPRIRGSVSQGLITDAGNFDLLSERNGDSDAFLWSSFANPTDTLLPTQSIEVKGNPSSHQTATSIKKGRFRLRLGDDGDLRLLTLNRNAHINRYILLVTPKILRIQGIDWFSTSYASCMYY